MNFIKSLVNNPKTSIKETATPDVTNDQSQKESPAAPTATVVQVSEPPAPPKGMSVPPPPPPPAPPKLEIKAEAKPKEEAAAKKADAPKGKSPLSSFFRSKTTKEAPQAEVEVTPVVEGKEAPVVEAEPVLAVQSDDNVQEETNQEANTLVTLEQVVEDVPAVTEAEKANPPKAPDATAKPEPPAPGQEEKKTGSKIVFKSLFKSKAASPKTASPTPPASPATPVAPIKPKEEAKSAEAAADSKAAAAVGDDAAKGLKKGEKRNSLQGFFKNLGQKRSSTDAAVEEKAK